MKYFKKLVGDRIYLSPRSTEDVEKFTEWLNDFEVTDYIGRSGKIMSLEGEKKYLEENSNPEAIFSMVTLDEDKLIGSVGLEMIDHLNRKATLGIFIGDKDYRSKGYGTEAIRMILDYGFNYMNLNNIKAAFFDLDGTLIDTEKIYVKCWKKAGDLCGYPMEWDRVYSLRSMDRQLGIERFKEYYGDDDAYDKIRNKRKELMAEVLKTATALRWRSYRRSRRNAARISRSHSVIPWSPRPRPSAKAPCPARITSRSAATWRSLRRLPSTCRMPATTC